MRARFPGALYPIAGGARDNRIAASTDHTPETVHAPRDPVYKPPRADPGRPRETANALASYADLAAAVAVLQAAGLPLRAVAARLNSEGHTTRRTGKPWNPVQVAGVLGRAGAALCRPSDTGAMP
jgi:hypothetical protein